MSGERFGKILVVALLASGLPAVVSAQSAITGLVTDNTGGVLPGVTVDAASPALIEQVRTAVTDGQGRYTIVDLRPGIYKVTFSLPGFRTVQRDGLQLPGDFTMTVNAEMQVGSIEETITVSGASPVVDVQNTARTQVLSRSVIDSVPNARNIQSIGALVPGIRLNAPDVGGSQQMEQTYMSVHGASARHTTVQIDGMMVNGLQSGGQIQNYHNNALMQEVTYQTSGISAEVAAGGVRLNMIAREGGNQFGGSAWISGSDGGWQWDNVRPELRQRGLELGDAIKHIYDVNISQGGPFKRDKLWFFSSVRFMSTDELVTDTFFDDGRQGYEDQYVRSGLLRLTWQATQRNKITAYMDRIFKFKGHEMGARTDPETGASYRYPKLYYVGQAKWTSTVSSRMLVEAGYSTNIENYPIVYQPGIRRERPSDLRTCLATPCFWEASYDQTTPWHRQASKQDRDLGTLWNAAAPEQNRHPERFVASGAMSYVTGSHAFKTGVQWTFGPDIRTRTANADLRQEYRSGVPDSVLVYNTPVWDESRLNVDLGVYAQDQWTIDRMTVNAGARLEWLNASIQDQAAAPGRFTPFRQFEGVPDLPNWFDVSPRFGLTYDLFGTSKTALKFTVGKYTFPETTDYAATYNPMLFASDRRTWRDLNGDDIAQDNEIGPSNNLRFGIRSPRNPDPDRKREYNLSYSAGIDHEVFPGVSMTVAWYRRNFYNLPTSDNLLRTLDDWAALTIHSPIDGTPIRAYNLNAAKRGLLDIIDTNSKNSDLRRIDYNGFEVSGTARLPNGGTVFGGWTTERSVTVACEGTVGTVIDDPNTFRFCNRAGLDQASGVEIDIPFRHEFKLAGSYPLPWGFEASAALISYAGEETRVDWVITPTTRYAATCPGPCRPGDRVIPSMTESSLTVRLTPPGTQYLDRWTQLDAGVQKAFRFGDRQVAVQVDFFNALNASPVLAETVTWGPALGRPTRILQGRLLRLATEVKW